MEIVEIKILTRDGVKDNNIWKIVSLAKHGANVQIFSEKP